MSAELHLIVHPRDTYAKLARSRAPIGPFAALRRPALVAIVLGASIAIAATGRVTPRLLVSTTAVWLFVVVLQVVIALTLIAAPARRTVGLARALDLFFASHVPWSLWMLGVAAWSPSPIGRPVIPVVVAAIVPMVLTARMISAFFREVLEMDPRHARARTLAHQAATWTVFAILAASAVAIVPRVQQWIG